MGLGGQLLIVEDLVETRTWLAVIGRATFGAEPVLVESLRAARAWCARRPRGPLTALVDIGLPDGSGLELIRELADQGDAIIVVTTIFEDDDTLFAAFAAGAHGYLLKSAGRDDVARRLRDLQAGEIAISPSMARRLLGRFRRTAPAEFVPLTARESEVLSVIGRGLTLIEAGHALGISESTVGTHVKTIYRKLHIASRAEAALEARQRGLA